MRRRTYEQASYAGVAPAQRGEPPLGYPEVTHAVDKAQLVMPDVIQDAISTEKGTLAFSELETSLIVAQERGLGMVDQQDRWVAVAEEEDEQPAVFIRGAQKAPRYNYARIVPRRQESRSLAIQFIAAMLSVMVLFSIFTAVSPLGRTIASLGFVGTYANSIPLAPTATPKPKPAANAPGANPGTQAVVNEIDSVFGSYSQGALNVARCESGYNPNAYNPYAIGSSHAEGVFQILYPGTWDTTAYASYSPYDANYNIHAAYQIFVRDGYSWKEWSCLP